MSTTASAYSETSYDNIANALYEALNSHDPDYGYIYFVRNITTDFVRVGITYNIVDKMNSYEDEKFKSYQLDGFIYAKNPNEILNQMKNEYKEYIHSANFFTLNITKSEEIIKIFDGKFIKARLNRYLNISQGIVFGYTPWDKIYKDNLQISNQILKFMEDQNLTSIETTVNELKSYIFNRNAIEQKEIRKYLKLFPYSISVKRYNSYWVGHNVLGRTYIITTDHLKEIIAKYNNQ